MHICTLALHSVSNYNASHNYFCFTEFTAPFYCPNWSFIPYCILCVYISIQTIAYIPLCNHNSFIMSPCSASFDVFLLLKYMHALCRVIAVVEVLWRKYFIIRKFVCCMSRIITLTMWPWWCWWMDSDLVSSVCLLDSPTS